MWTFRNDVKHLKLCTYRCLLLRPGTCRLLLTPLYAHMGSRWQFTKCALRSNTSASDDFSSLSIHVKLQRFGGFERYWVFQDSLGSVVMLCSILHPPCFRVCSDTLTMPFWQDCTAIHLLSTGPLDGGKTLSTESSHFQRHLEAWLNAWLSSIRLGHRSIGKLYWHRSTVKNKITNKKDDQQHTHQQVARPEFEAPSRHV